MVAEITDDLDELLAFYYDLPAEHRKHLHTTNAIEPAFATVRLRQRVAKGPGCRAAETAMGFKLMQTGPTNAGAASTVTNWSRSCAPAPRSSTANYKDDPTNRKGT